MEQTILTGAQKTALRCVAEDEGLSNFYLTGGTALAAFYLRHRLSEDLDFFTADPVDGAYVQRVAEGIAKAVGAADMAFERKYDRRMFLLTLPDAKELKVEFTRYAFKQLEDRRLVDGFRVDSLRDIAANKLMAMTDRFDPKDFVDLYYLLQKFPLKQVRQDVMQKFDTRMQDMFLGSELAKAHRIEALPRMLVSLTIYELKDFFTKQAKALQDEVLE